MMEIEKSMLERFGIRYLMPNQIAVIGNIIENSGKDERTDSITVLPTGSGKSLCFMIPALLFKESYTILLYPLLSLMNDQARRLEEAKIPYSMIKGGMGRDEKMRELDRLRKMEASILITNIESLIILGKKDSLSFLRGRTELFVIDEAHTAISWASFRPAMREIGRISREIGAHQRLLFTATADESILEALKHDVLSNPKASLLRLSADRANIFYSSRRSLSKRADIIALLRKNESRPALVFCSYRKECEEYYDKIRGTYDSFFYHAGLEKEEKIRLEKEFRKSREAVMFATNAYGLGVDKKDIRTIIHIHAPDDAAAFLQEAGRGGRDNGFTRSIVLYSESDKGKLKSVFSKGKCIRAELLRLMGEKDKEDCAFCSKCLGEDETAEGEKEILSLVSRLPLILTQNSLFTLLSLRRLKTWDEGEIREAIRTLIKERKIIGLLGHLIRGRKAK